MKQHFLRSSMFHNCIVLKEVVVIECFVIKMTFPEEFASGCNTTNFFMFFGINLENIAPCLPLKTMGKKKEVSPF